MRTFVRRALRPNLLAVTVLLVGLGGTSYAMGRTQASAPNHLNACVNGGGHLRLLRAGGSCYSWEELVTWNVQGPRGAKGPRGVIGTRGPQGVPGPKGETGNTGPSDVLTATSSITVGPGAFVVLARMTMHDTDGTAGEQRCQLVENSTGQPIDDAWESFAADGHVTFSMVGVLHPNSPEKLGVVCFTDRTVVFTSGPTFTALRVNDGPSTP